MCEEMPSAAFYDKVLMVHNKKYCSFICHPIASMHVIISVCLYINIDLIFVINAGFLLEFLEAVM